jgi:hypothetical protein
LHRGTRMPISVNCPSCGSRLKAPDSAAGRKTKCPKCGTALVVPRPDSQEAEGQPPQPLPQSIKHREPTPASLQRPPEPAAAPVSEVQTRQRPESTENALGESAQASTPGPVPVIVSGSKAGKLAEIASVVLGLMVLVGLVLVGDAIWGYWRDFGASTASTEPERISLRHLIKRGPKGNPHLEITDYGPGPEFLHLVDEKDRSDLGSFFPLVCDDELTRSGADKPGQIFVVIRTNDTKLDELKPMLERRSPVRGMVASKEVSLTDYQKQKLKQLYPLANFDDVIVISAGSVPTPAGEKFYPLVIGLVLLTASVAIIWRMPSPAEASPEPVAEEAP